MTIGTASETAVPRSGLAGLLGIEQTERTTLGLIAALAFVLAVSFVLVQTTADGLFIDEFGARELPFAYLSIAVLSSVVAYLYLRLSGRLAFRRILFVNLGFLVIVCLVFWVGLRSPSAHWFIFFLPFWFQTLVNLANLIVWPVAGHVFNVRQAKRLFGVVAAGTWVANLLGGGVIAPILTTTSTSSLYLLAALVLVVAAPVLWVVSKRHLNDGSSRIDPGPQPEAPHATSMRSALGNRYSRLIFAYMLLWWLSFCFIDNIFFDRAEVQFPTSSLLAGFIGKQLSVMGFIALITTLFLTARIVGRFGLRAALLLMPIVVTAAMLALAVGGMLGMPTVALFWIATVAKTFNVALGFSISQAAGALLYQPLLGHHRHSTETIAEGIVQPVAVGLAGLILLLFTTAAHFNVIGLSYLFLIIAALWFWVIGQISREYTGALSEALRKRSLGESTSLLFDPAGLAQLEGSLQSPRASVVLYSLNQLEQLEPRTWERIFRDALAGLLAHPAPEVRSEALRRVLALRRSEALPIVRGRLDQESAPEVYAILIQVLATLGGATADSHIAEALNSPLRLIRQGAIVGLLSSGIPAQIARGRNSVQVMVSSPEVEERAGAATIMAESRFHGSKVLVANLLVDPAAEVRKAAILAAGCFEDPELLDKVISACESAETAPLAERVLVSKGARSIPAVSRSLQAKETPPASRSRVLSLIRVLGRIPDDEAVDVLRSAMGRVDPEMRLAVLRALSVHGFRARPQDGVPTQIQKEIESAAWIAAAIQTVHDAGGGPRLRILSSALESAFREARSRVLLLLSFVYEAPAVLRAERALQETADFRREYAAETVDSLLPARLRPRVLPLLEKASFRERLRLWQTAGMSVSAPRLEALIVELIGDRAESQFSAWTRLCAMHAAGALGIQASVPALEVLRSASDIPLRQSAQWTLARLQSRDSFGGGPDMLSLVEKVLILKAANLFSETPDNVLADIAGFAEEILADENQVIFKKGEPGDSLYIIVTGAVKVLDGGRLLNRLGEGDIFGELALLDPEPRVATVQATEATHLLRLDEAHFRLILAERPEVSGAIIRVITRYLRSVLRGGGDVDPNLTLPGLRKPPAASPASG